jgi:glycine dehydrogenase subunit 1
VKYIPNSGESKDLMLKKIGFSQLDDLLEGIPDSLKLKRDLDFQESLSEMELRERMHGLAGKNISDPKTLFAGAGYFSHYVPSVVDTLASRSEFLTCYTPYQAEIGQGTLQAIYEFQSWIAHLTGMEVANASMYDGSTALAEAVLMAKRINKKRNKVIFAGSHHPEYIEVVITYCNELDIKIEFLEEDPESGHWDPNSLEKKVDDETLCVVVQNPAFNGTLSDLEKAGEIARKKDALFIASISEAFSLSLFKTPGECGADIVVGEGSPFGNPLQFGGPGFGFFACKQKFLRNMPGRLAGKTVDEDGKEGFVLTLATREQHIRRDKATSNICTNQGICATRAAIFFAVMGEEGLREMAEQSFSLAKYAEEQLAQKGIKRVHSGEFFNEFVVKVDHLDRKRKAALKDGVLPGVPLSRWGGPEDEVLLAFTEMNRKESIDQLVEVLSS